MSEIHYTADHEWISIDSDTATIGITDHAQKALGEVVYVDLPDVGVEFVKADVFAVVESVKAASDVYAPVSGEIVATNTALEESPERINDEAESGGWFVKLRLSEPFDPNAYMNKDAYLALLNED